MQEKYSELKGKLDIFKKANEELLKNKNAIELLSKDLEPKKEEYINLENEVKKIKIEILEIERENLAHKLREELKDKGNSVREIAKILGISKSKVGRLV